MSVLSLIEFDDVTEHSFDNTKMELLNDKGQLKSQVSANEILFSNFEGNVLPVLPEVSKRGDKTLVFSGTNNTGEIIGGVLNFPNNDASIGTYSKCFGTPLMLQMSGTGLVAPCGSFFSKKYGRHHIGRLEEQRFRDIWASDRYGDGDSAWNRDGGRGSARLASSRPYAPYARPMCPESSHAGQPLQRSCPRSRLR